jgi:hypothetical protein
MSPPFNEGFFRILFTPFLPTKNTAHKKVPIIIRGKNKNE